ncbi:MAG: phage tail protein [Nitrincola lacisaponensis]|uniref:phage tail protein n=1 Tax=Nitrincola lacisaponensis TaxID=267850 RepID=UPI003919E544
MRKPAELREWLLASVRDLKNNPEKLQIFIDAGNLQARLQDSLHFEYQYTLNLIVTDFAADTDYLMVPLLAWVKVEQPEMDIDAIRFQADIIDHLTIDISITLPLTERVLVTKNDNGNYTTHHASEPVPEWNLPEPEALQELTPNG